MNIRILHVRSDYHSIQAHEGIKVLVLRIHDVNHGAHIRPWYIEGHLGTRPALVRVRCAWTIGGPVRKGTPRHIEQLQCLERIHVHFLRTHRGRQEEGIIRLERFIHDFADARFPRATRSDHENFASRSIRHRIVLGRHASHHRPRVASRGRWARPAPSHVLSHQQRGGSDHPRPRASPFPDHGDQEKGVAESRYATLTCRSLYVCMRLTRDSGRLGCRQDIADEPMYVDGADR